MFRRVIVYEAFFLLFFAPVLLFSAPVFDHSDWDYLLKQYVHDGLVDYASLSKNRDILDHYLKRVEEVSLDTLGGFSREEKIAFWINVYNANVIRIVLDSYPIEQMNQIPAVFEIRTIHVGGEFFSLAEVRDEVLRRGFRDERVLTALVSARMDSPRLRPEAFRGDLLDRQLDQAAREFVEDNERNKIVPGEKKIFLSPLFHDFGSDFLLNFSSSAGFSDTDAAVISFCLHHLHNPEKRLFLDSRKYWVDYFPPDPRLNDIRIHSSLKTYAQKNL